jgi:hypothetical protein
VASAVSAVDSLIIPQSGAAMANRTVRVELSPGLNRVTVEGVPGTVVPASTDLVPVNGQVRVVFKRAGEGRLEFGVISEEAATEDFHLSYSFTGLTWCPSYTVFLSASEDSAEFAGWYGISNKTTMTFAPAHVVLAAGPGYGLGGRPPHRVGASLGESVRDLSPAPEIPALSETFLPFVRVPSMPARTINVVERLGPYNPEPPAPKRDDRPVLVTLELTNQKGSGHWVPDPIPPGAVRVFARTKDGTTYFLGEDTFSQSAALPAFLARLGRSPSLKAERMRTDQKKIGTSSWEEAYQVRVTNLGAHDAEVVVVEELPGEWTILQSTPAFWTKTPSGFAQFVATVPAGGRVDVLFRVRFTL